MRKRPFGRTGVLVGDVGYGMWGMGGWTGSDDEESLEALRLAADLGCTFFDTALAYGDGHSERLLGRLLREEPSHSLFTASKIPPRNRVWPARPGVPLADVFPPSHIRRSTLQSLENIGVDSLDLIQFHVWSDEWAHDPSWQQAVTGLRDEGLVRAVGISVNRWEPANVLETLRTGLIDAVQVVYNVLDQAPEDELLPLCRELGIAVVARVPFDEGTLTGTLTLESSWPPDDFRAAYFAGDNLVEAVRRAGALEAVLPPGLSLPELALRFILSHEAVTTVIPGMRRPANVRANMAASDAGPLPPELLAALRPHRWDSTPDGYPG